MCTSSIMKLLEEIIPSINSKKTTTEKEKILKYIFMHTELYIIINKDYKYTYTY